MDNFADQFARLETIARSANTFLMGAGDKYTGPIRPAGIIRQTSNDSRPIPKRKDGGLSQNYLVLADHVPLKFTMGDAVDGSEPYPTGLVLAPLNDNYEFLDWHSQTKTLASLQAQLWCSDGSMESACADLTDNGVGRFTWQVVFRRGQEQPRTEPPRARAEAFNADEYSKGGWKTAVEPQYTHYQRLGLNAREHVSTENVKKANLVRANWWRQRKSQADSGKNNPLIAELIPHFKIAETNLQMAVAVLSDVDQKAAYDRQVETAGARAVEGKLQEFIRFTLRDNILTPAEKNDLLDQAHDLGILRERAEELIRDEMRRTGAIEGADPYPGGPRRDPTTPVVTGSDRPRLALSQTALSLGTLRKGQECVRAFMIDNLGGGVLQGAIDVSHPEWLNVSQPEIDPRRHHQEVTVRIDTSNLALGTNYVGMVDVRSNGGRQGVRIDFAIELEKSAVSRYRTQLFWMGLLAGGIFGLLLYGLISDPLAGNTITRIAGTLGFIAFVVVCAKAGGWGGGIGGFLLAGVSQEILQYLSMRAYSAGAWAAIVSAFLYFCARRLLVANLSGDRRTRAWVAVSGVGLVAIIILGGLGTVAAVRPRPDHPNLSIALPVEDKLVGQSIGYPGGIRWAPALGGRGAVFSAADSSRIEYPGLIPSEGTLEFWIKVNSGYGYNNFQLRTDQDDAMIFSSDAQGGDVTWPGTTRFSVSRSGTLSYWMATSKYNKPPASATEARQTKFRFGEWHAIGLSYGTEGQYIMLDGKLVAASPGQKQTFGRAGNHQEPLDIPTIGETVSHYWPHHRSEGGFEGVVAAFRVSATQTDWKLAQGVKGDITPEAIDTGENRAPDGGPHQWTELKLGDRKGDFALNTDHRLYYRNVVLQGFVIPSESDGAWVSPSSSNGDVLCFSMGNQAQGILIHLPTLTGVVVLDGSKFAFGLSAVQWTSWSPDGGYWLAAHYNEAHVELFVIDARDREARRVPISLANEHEELAFDLDSVTWESTDRFRMRAKINCNPYTSQETCSDAERKKTLRVYDLVVNARSLDVSSTVQPGPPKSADVPGEGSTPSENGSGSLSSRLDPSERLLRRDELEGLTKWDLEILRNLPYARHGYSFRQQELKNYFSEQPWYRATVPAEQFRPSTLTPVERENITLISQFQKERGLGVSAADQLGPPKSADVPDGSKVPVTPSFDCSKARTPTEQLICREPDLALMEREMVSAYKQAIERASTDQKAVVRREHLQWFNRYARACDAVLSETERRGCISRELRNRTEELRGSGSGNRTALPDGALKPYRVGQGVLPPAVLSKVEPLYSDQARNAKLQGNVLVQLVVDEHGLPRQIRVMRSLGMGLDEKAVEAVQQWRFRPGVKDGHAVSVQATIEVNFRLL